jgi:hypothetical protein
MAGNATGGIRGAARRQGLTEDAYRAHVAAGEKWCGGCKKWHPRSAFGSDRSRNDGLAARCLASKAEQSRAKYQPKPSVSRVGRRYVSARDGDKKQARARVNHRVDIGLIPDPNNLPRTDCGHAQGTSECRHEYDHHLGYAAEHQESVEAVCSPCHHRREIARRQSAGRTLDGVIHDDYPTPRPGRFGDAARGKQ